MSNQKPDIKLKADGTVDTSNVTAYSTSLAGNMMVFLQVVSATGPQHIPNGDKTDQLMMTPQQAQEIGQALLNAASIALSHTVGSKPN